MSAWKQAAAAAAAAGSIRHQCKHQGTKLPRNWPTYQGYASIGTIANSIWAVQTGSCWELGDRVQQVETRGCIQAQDPLGMCTPRPFRGVTPRKFVIPHDIAYLCLQQSPSESHVPEAPTSRLLPAYLQGIGILAFELSL